MVPRPEENRDPAGGAAAGGRRMRPRRHGPWKHRRFRHALMPKLLLVLLATGLFVNFTVGGFYRLMFSQQAHAALESNVAHYAHLLAAEIGTPPDTAKARALGTAYGLRIRYTGPGVDGAWDSRPGEGMDPTASWNQGSETRMEGRDAATLGWKHGRFFVSVQEGGGEYRFVTDFRQLVDSHRNYLGIVILILSLVLACAFMAIRRLLSPLKKLTAGVERLGQGELGHQVPVCSHDEFGDLAESFNTMSSRLAALVRAREQLLLDVSHELRSPITRIKVALEMAPEGMDTEGIRDDLREMETMIGEILEAARLDSVNGKLNLEEIDLGVLVSEAVSDANIRPPGAILVGNTAATERDGLGPMIKVDRARVRKVLANVLDNAVKFSQIPSGGKADGTAPGDMRGENVPVEVRIEAEGHEFTVRVRDRGMGIPAAELANLFEPFYRVDRSRSRDTGGYGLGLSLCKRIMEAHGGSIGITSREGEGTEVFLVFPAQSVP